MTHDELEFAISQYLDGELPTEQRAELEQVLARDAEARRVLEQYRALDGLLRRSTAPAVDYGRLAAAISAGVDEAASAQPVDEPTELAITQYLDGELVGAERAAMERRLESDAAVRRVAREYQALDRLLRRATAVPEVDWTRLSERLSDAVAEVEERRRYSLVWIRRGVRVAAAACVALALALVTLLLLNRDGNGGAPNRVAEVHTFISEPAAGRRVAQVTVGAMDDVADLSYTAAELMERSVPRLSITIAPQAGRGVDNALFQ